MTAVPNSSDGLSIVADKPMNNDIQLNVNRRAVLRQYYGLSVPCGADGISHRPAFGYRNGR